MYLNCCLDFASMLKLSFEIVFLWISGFLLCEQPSALDLQQVSWLGVDALAVKTERTGS